MQIVRGPRMCTLRANESRNTEGQQIDELAVIAASFRILLHVQLPKDVLYVDIILRHRQNGPS